MSVEKDITSTVESYNNDDDILDDIWTFYFHDPYDVSWTCGSYHRICDMGSAMELVAVQKKIKEHLHQGMFFLFRESVFPCWDDPANIRGGCLSIKVLKADLSEFWFQLCAKLLSEELLSADAKETFGWDVVTGVSSSPKRMFCIVKIWVRNDDLNSPSMFELPTVSHGEVLFRSNRDNIDVNHVRHTRKPSHRPIESIPAVVSDSPQSAA